MANTIIEMDDVSKMYRLGDVNSGTLSHDLNRLWQRVRGKEDPGERLAESNDTSAGAASGYIWSLKDISFSVNRGEVFGIVGKNGAGKSTVLKLLSKITKPTRGCIRIDGRIASLLEVGTGFHPDLSGRENIFLNGAILGMRKTEIRRSFDEIVAFSGIERYIDTPVKRYSSGMFVRLAFAVAAHLDPEILIVDEVLAVGDAEFQEKCLGKMKDVSRNQGRTVLFVSHNIAAVKQLCHRALLLESGRTKMIGSIDKVLERYQTVEDNGSNGLRTNIPSGTGAYLAAWTTAGTTLENPHSCYTREEFTFSVACQVTRPLKKCEFHLILKQESETVLLHASSLDFGGSYFSMDAGYRHFQFRLSLPLRKGKYVVHTALLSDAQLIDSWISNTHLVIMDQFDGDARNNLSGLLNVKSVFSIAGDAAVHGTAFSRSV